MFQRLKNALTPLPVIKVRAVNGAILHIPMETYRDIIAATKAGQAPRYVATL